MTNIGVTYSIEEYKKNYNKVSKYPYLQFMLGNPKTYQVPDNSRYKEFLRSVSKGLILHGPFVTSLLKKTSTNHSINSFRCIRDSLILCKDVGVSRYVTHLGGREDLETDTIEVLTDNLRRIESTVDMTKVILCLENDPGSSTGKKSGSVENIIKALKIIDNPNIRLCFDVEHAFANGELKNSISFIESVLDMSALVHLNSIPKYVSYGGHLDRHSDDAIIDSHREYVDVILYIAKRCEERGIPYILEREIDIANEDYKLISRYLEEG